MYDVNERKVLLKFAFDIITDVVVCPLLKIFFFGIKEDGVSKVCAVEAESLTVKWTTVMQASLSNKPVLTNEEELIIRYIIFPSLNIPRFCIVAQNLSLRLQGSKLFQTVCLFLFPFENKVYILEHDSAN